METEPDPAKGEVAEIRVPVAKMAAPFPESQEIAEQTVFPQGDDMVVVARYPYQMDSCQRSIKEWAEKKVAECKAEVDDLTENVEMAKKNKWGSSALVRQKVRAQKRFEFYDKIRLAIEAGYCIVPNFPVDMMAFRTKRKNPKQTESSYFDKAKKVEDQSAPLPAGEGSFVNSDVLVSERVEKTTRQDGSERIDRYYFPIEYGDVEFPIATAKPQVLSATARAMAGKFFDEIGVLPGKKKNQDPIVVGRIVDPRSSKYNKVVVTFLIAWFLDTRDI